MHKITIAFKMKGEPRQYLEVLASLVNQAISHLQKLGAKKIKVLS